MISTLCALMAVVHVKNTNLLASEDITVATARLSSSKQIIGMRTLIRFTVQRSGVSLPANPQVQWSYREGRITSDGIKQSIRFTDVYQVMIPPLSGGLEFGVTRLSSLKVNFHLRVSIDKCINEKLSEVQLLRLRATFHALPLFYFRT